MVEIFIRQSCCAWCGLLVHVVGNTLNFQLFRNVLLRRFGGPSKSCDCPQVNRTTVVVGSNAT